MNDMSQAIIPKSDQISADDLIAGPITIQITGVDIKAGTEQPVAVSFVDDNGRPWKPCKSMSRVLVSAWGADAKAYVGRSLTLYRDPTVKWGGMEVGGIRVSHMSHIAKPMTLALTATKGSRKPFVVKPLDTTQSPPGSPRTPETPPDPPTLAERVSRACSALSGAADQAALDNVWAKMASLRADADADPPEAQRLITARDARAAAFVGSDEAPAEPSY